ncbi:MAG: SPASM domain-containing protein [DPANN group archaeon]|nr:SPASM domain-containing protein [DPANN group archaeon]
MKFYRFMEFFNRFLALTGNRSLAQNAKVAVNLLAYHIRPWGDISQHKPITAQIEPTLRCNLACRMCVRTELGVPLGEMSFETFKTVIDKLDTVVKIHLQGQGEPFLARDLFQMINYAASKGIVVNLTSNATLFTEKIVEKICQSQVNKMILSVDSTERETYESIRKLAKFDVVVAGIKRLTAKRKETSAKFRLALAAVVMKKNMREIPKFVQFARELGIEQIEFQDLQEKDDYLEKYEKTGFSKDEVVVSYKEQIKKLISEARAEGKNLGVAVAYDDEHDSKCIWPWRSIYLNWQGRVTPCCVILEPHKFGDMNLTEQSLGEIWNGAYYRALRDGLLNKNVQMFKLCEGCRWAKPYLQMKNPAGLPGISMAVAH